jgi:hypothetical protein
MWPLPIGIRAGAALPGGQFLPGRLPTINHKIRG